MWTVSMKGLKEAAADIVNHSLTLKIYTKYKIYHEKSDKMLCRFLI